jgi:hypothetical protein
MINYTAVLMPTILSMTLCEIFILSVESPLMADSWQLRTYCLVLVKPSPMALNLTEIVSMVVALTDMP